MTGSLLTVAVSQGKDRRSARAACHVRLRQVFVLGAQTSDLNEDSRRDSFYDALVELEAATLSAGLPHRLVDLYIKLRDDMYYSMAASQLASNESFRKEWENYISELSILIASVELQLRTLLWHPWRERFFAPSKIGRTEILCYEFLKCNLELRNGLREYVGRTIRSQYAEGNKPPD